MAPPYHTIDQLFCYIAPPNRDYCKKIIKDNRELFEQVQGSKTKHQAWKGGYIDHVTEVMNFGVMLYEGLQERLSLLSISRSDILLILFLHDLEKPWEYRLLDDGTLEYRSELADKQAQKNFRHKKIREYGIVLTEEQENALRYAEGEGDDYTPHERVMGRLAGIVHPCDVLSAVTFHDFPRRG